jgi:hypothetical protein
MWPDSWEDFSGAWSIDFEFAACGTGQPIPHTLVAADLLSGCEIRLAGSKLRAVRQVPFDVRRSVCIAYNFVAEATCFEVLGWEQPHWPLDLYAEHLALTNGLLAKDIFESAEDDQRLRYRLIDALRFHGIEVSDEDEVHKQEMQKRAAQGEPFTAHEWNVITEYCADDVSKLSCLFKAMRNKLDFAAAFIRGRFMTVIGQQTHRGIPVNRALVEKFEAWRPDLRQTLINELPTAKRFYNAGRFSESLFSEWTEDEEIGWPRHKDGSPVLEHDILRRIAELELSCLT